MLSLSFKHTLFHSLTHIHTHYHHYHSQVTASVRGTPADVLSVLMHGSANTTILGPASKVELLECTKQNETTKEVSRGEVGGKRLREGMHQAERDHEGGEPGRGWWKEIEGGDAPSRTRPRRK